MPQWNNKDLFVYHGTDSASVGVSDPLGVPLVASGATLSSFAVRLALCRPRTDFGRGFYVTTNPHQARQWANTRVISLPSRAVFAVVLRFQLNRDWLAGLDALAFVRPTQDFWDLVTDCRIGFPPHQRSSSHPYDVVYGPVTLWPQQLIINDCDQISFHSTQAAAALPSPIVHRRAIDGAKRSTLF
ncbi:DUF3990 domain-containing protein [Bradyrhizobium forestalis]|uniref:DUF3990 domain-containing protein n=1 Tax=Bradyrhizobium forestalis TaxID=1419263 RepID=UPI0013044334|nr:DUF3990 domain-containing protein [Bradyrhizobium forestalis]